MSRGFGLHGSKDRLYRPFIETFIPPEVVVRHYFSSLLLVSVVLLVVVAPFLAFGPQLEGAVSDWLAARPDPWILAGAVVGLLAVDILLPIPSSVVGTLAGAELGVFGGMAATWLGLTLGAIIGYYL